MEEIRFDFELARQQEQKLDEMAAELEQSVRGPYADAMQDLQNGWQSDGSIKFMQKGQRLEEKMLESASLIRQTKEALHRAYVQAELREEKAKEIAEDRTVNT